MQSQKYPNFYFVAPNSDFKKSLVNFLKNEGKNYKKLPSIPILKGQTLFQVLNSQINATTQS